MVSDDGIKLVTVAKTVNEQEKLEKDCKQIADLAINYIDEIQKVNEIKH